MLAGIGFTACGQLKEIDSLQRLVAASTGTKKIDALNALAFVQIIGDLDEAEETIKQAIYLSEKSNYKHGLAEANVYMGICENSKGNKNVSLDFNKKGIQLAREANLTGLQGYGLVQRGNVFRNYAEFDSALHWYSQAREVLKDSLNPAQLSVLYRNLGRLYKLKGEPKKEITYLTRSYHIRKNLTDMVLLSDILTQLSGWYIDQANIEKAKEYLDEAERVGPRDSLFEIEQGIKYQKAIIAFSQARYPEALRLLRSVKEYYSRLGDIKQFVRMQLDLATVLHEFADFDLSLKNALEALTLSEKNKFTDNETSARLVIAWNYYRINQLPLAKEYVDKAMQMAKENKFKPEIASAQMLKALILNAEKNYGAALQYLEQSLAIRKEIEDDKGAATTLSVMGETHEQLGNLTKATSLYQQSLAIRERILHQNGLAWIYLNLGSVYTKLNDFAQATLFLDKAEAKSRSIKSGTLLLNVYRAKRHLLQQQGNLRQALSYSFLFEEIKDSVNSAAVNNRILWLQSVYEMDKQTQEIQLLNQQKQAQQDQITIQTGQIRQQRMVIASVAIGSIFLGALAFVSYQYFKKTKKLNIKLQEQNEEITTQTEELAESNSTLLDLNKSLSDKQNEIEAQTEELRESHSMIAQLNQNLEIKVNERTSQLQQAYKELDTFFYRSSHDFRRPLTTFMGLAEVARITLKEKEAIELFAKVEETAVNLDRMLIKLQSISDVEADQIAVKGVSIKSIFENVLHAYRQNLAEHGIRAEINVLNDRIIKSYPAYLKTIMENLVENAIHFRSYDKPFIRLEAIINQQNLVIKVTDNGAGIDEAYINMVFDMFFRGSERSKGNGLGLYIAKKAVEKMNGHIHVENNDTDGCTFTVELPLITT